jgi:pyruvate,water dikinase
MGRNALHAASERPLILKFERVRRKDGQIVGGKNSSLGEMISALTDEGIKVPPGFATTSQMYWEYVDANRIWEEAAKVIAEWQYGKVCLQDAGSKIRRLFLGGTWPTDAAVAIKAAYSELCSKAGVENLSVAVRSSATAEDLPEASFAGQQETYLNISGEESLLAACRRCYASLFTDRAISYRQTRAFDHMSVALSIGVQRRRYFWVCIRRIIRYIDRDLRRI